MTNGFRGLLVGGGEPIYVKLKEVEKLAVRHFKNIICLMGHSKIVLRFLQNFAMTHRTIHKDP